MREICSLNVCRYNNGKARKALPHGDYQENSKANVSPTDIGY